MLLTSITITLLDAIMLSSQSPDLQIQCRFLKDFPIEIRLQIYREVIRSFMWGETVHVLLQDQELTDEQPGQEKQLTYVPCTLPCADHLSPTQGRNTYSYIWPTQHESCRVWKTSVKLQSTYLSLFASCQRM